MEDDYRRINQVEGKLWRARRGKGKLCRCCCDAADIRAEIRCINRARRRLDSAIVDAELAAMEPLSWQAEEAQRAREAVYASLIIPAHGIPAHWRKR